MQNPIHDTRGARVQAAARDEANGDHDTNGEGEVHDLINQVENVPPEGRLDENDRVVQNKIVQPPVESVDPALALTRRLLLS